MLGHDGLSGDAPAAISLPQQLQYELNRFVGSPTSDIRPFAVPLPVTGTIDAATADRAIGVLATRAVVDGDDDLSRKLTAEGYLNPVGYVTKYLSSTVNIVQNFANFNGLPKSTYGGAVGGGFLGLSTTELIVGGVVIYLLFLRKK